MIRIEPCGVQLSTCSQEVDSFLHHFDFPAGRKTANETCACSISVLSGECEVAVISPRVHTSIFHDGGGGDFTRTGRYDLEGVGKVSHTLRVGRGHVLSRQLTALVETTRGREEEGEASKLGRKDLSNGVSFENFVFDLFKYVCVFMFSEAETSRDSKATRVEFTKGIDEERRAVSSCGIDPVRFGGHNLIGRGILSNEVSFSQGTVLVVSPRVGAVCTETRSIACRGRPVDDIGRGVFESGCWVCGVYESVK